MPFTLYAQKSEIGGNGPFSTHSCPFRHALSRAFIKIFNLWKTSVQMKVLSPQTGREVFGSGWSHREESMGVLFPQIPNSPVGSGPRYVDANRNVIRRLTFKLKF